MNPIVPVAQQRCRSCHGLTQMAELIAYRGRCEDCAAVQMQKQGSPGRPAEARSATIFWRRGRQPGAGDGNDFFGNHT